MSRLVRRELAELAEQHVTRDRRGKKKRRSTPFVFNVALFCPDSLPPIALWQGLRRRSRVFIESIGWLWTFKFADLVRAMN